MRYDVTIGIPMYNVEDYIARTMESALAQTYQSIEYLIVDDGSRDGSIDIVHEFQSRHPRGRDIRIITHSKNLGPSAARNRIIDEAKGEYLFFLDSDDVIRKDTISLMMDHVLDNNAEIVFGSMEKILLSGERRVYQYPQMIFNKENELANFSYRRYAGIQASACNFLVRVSIIRVSGLRFYNFDYWEDFVFVLDLVTYISRAALLSDTTYTYLCRHNSLSNYQERGSIEKSEILRNIAVASYMKDNSLRLKDKPYYPQRCYVAVMTDFYIACHILKRRQVIAPPIKNHEIKEFLSHPASFSQICSFQQMRITNMVLYLIGKLPSPVCVSAVWVLGKMKKLI